MIEVSFVKLPPDEWHMTFTDEKSDFTIIVP